LNLVPLHRPAHLHGRLPAHHRGVDSARPACRRQQKGQGQARRGNSARIAGQDRRDGEPGRLQLGRCQDQTPIPKKGADYDFERLAAELKKAKDGHPDKNDAQVASEDTIKFDVLIRAMTPPYKRRFPDILAY